jgi:hypothetical protein
MTINGLFGNNFVNCGRDPRIYAPSFFSAGSSISHLDENAFPEGHPDSLMTPVLAKGETILDQGLGIEMLLDISWKLPR